MIRALGSIAVPLPQFFTDACFSGIGHNSQSVLIAVERKKLGDLCSCILNGRFLFQMQGCKEAGADVLCLIVEGECRPSPDDGLLEVPVWRAFQQKRKQVWEPVKPTMTYSRFCQYLVELEYLAGILVFRSRDVQETAAIIKSLWDNFQTLPDDHNSLHQIFHTPMPTVPLMRPSLVRRVASELPGVGWTRSKVVAERFLTVRAMTEASEKEWASLEGIGKVTARKVVQALGGGNGKK
jgi:ERCC4-type nuclease